MNRDLAEFHAELVVHIGRWGSNFFDLGQVGSNFCCSGWVRSAIFGLGLEIFPLNIPNFQYLPIGSKKDLIGLGQKVPGSKTGQPLIYCSGRVGTGPISRCAWSELELSAWGVEKPPNLSLRPNFSSLALKLWEIFEVKEIERSLFSL